MNSSIDDLEQLNETYTEAPHIAYPTKEDSVLNETIKSLKSRDP